MIEKELITTVNYTINLSEYDKAFKAFQKKYVFPKNIAMTTIFTVIIAMYINSLTKDAAYTMGYILIAVCLGFIFVIWYNTIRISRTLIDSIKDIEDDKYTTNIYDEGI